MYVLMRKNLATIVCTITLCLSLVTQAQTPNNGHLTGNVVDDHQKPMDDVSVALLRAKDSTIVKGAITSAEGSFVFDHLPEDAYLIAFNMIGYARVIKGPFRIDQQHQAYTSGDILLSPTSKQLNSVNIVAKKPLVERQVDKTVLNIENSILATGNTALEILRKAPGVSVDKDGNISMRGKKGVSLMIDGKLTYLSNEEVANLLNATEGNAISSIELITNPSSKYDAAGNSGIINIRLKKNRNYGTNGTVTAGAGYGRYDKENSGLTFNKREKKFNIFGDVNYARNKRFTDQEVDRVTNTKNGQTFFDQSGGYSGVRNNTNYKTGLDYFINDQHTIGMALNGYLTKANQVTDINTRISKDPHLTDSTLKAINPTRYTYRNTAYNLNYKGVLDTAGQEISFDADFSRYKRDKTDIYNNSWYDVNGQLIRPTVTFRNPTPSLVKIWVVKTDYTYPFSKKMKLDAGLKSSFVNTENTTIIDNLRDNQWQNDVRQSNHFMYDENINAAYGNFRAELKSLTLQLGLRAEQTNSKGYSLETQTTVNRHYLNLFPTVFINRVLSKNHEIGLSYSRRIERPNYSSLNPFIHYLDAYTYSQGNPFLNPQYTNSFEASWSYKKTINTSLGYSHTSDVIAFVTLNDTARKTLAASYRNLASLDTYNFNMNVPLTLTKWWSTSNNLTVFYNRFTSPELFGAAFKSGKLSFNINSTQTLTINPTLSAEVSAYYNSRNIEGTASNRELYSVDMGLSKMLLNKKLSIKLAASDVFNTLRYVSRSKIPGQDYIYNAKEETRILRLTGVYHFGSSAIKGARKRNKGSEEEQNRAKS